MENKSHLWVRMLCEGAVMVVIAQILSYLKLFEMPQGGSVCLAMAPILFFAVRWGVRDGLLAGCVLGILQFLLDGGFAIGWQSILGDYLIAFLVLGLAGVAKGRPWGVVWGGFVGCAARFLVHFVVGATVWAEYMPDVYVGLTMTNPWIYSLLYNTFYMLPSTIACLAVLAALYVPLKSYALGQDLR